MDIIIIKKADPDNFLVLLNQKIPYRQLSEYIISLKDDGFVVILNYAHTNSLILRRMSFKEVLLFLYNDYLYLNLITSGFVVSEIYTFQFLPNQKLKTVKKWGVSFKRYS